jgi:hypothetical protein
MLVGLIRAVSPRAFSFLIASETKLQIVEKADFVSRLLVASLLPKRRICFADMTLRLMSRYDVRSIMRVRITE